MDCRREPRAKHQMGENPGIFTESVPSRANTRQYLETKDKIIYDTDKKDERQTRHPQQRTKDVAAYVRQHRAGTRNTQIHCRGQRWDQLLTQNAHREHATLSLSLFSRLLAYARDARNSHAHAMLPTSGGAGAKAVVLFAFTPFTKLHRSISVLVCGPQGGVAAAWPCSLCPYKRRTTHLLWCNSRDAAHRTGI